MSVDLKTFLQGRLTDEELALLVRSYDMVGDIAVIIVPDELRSKERLIGQAILDNNKRIKTVLRRAGNYDGEFRKIPLQLIGGEDRRETVHKEYGVRLMVNPERAYYSPRSGTERFRVAAQVKPGEQVLVLFSGIGPFPLVIAANSEAEAVVGIEKNPDGHSLALKSLRLNKRIKNVTFMQGDVAELLPGLDKRFNRIIMPLPHGAHEYLAGALEKLLPGGWLHFYTMRAKEQFSDGLTELSGRCKDLGFKLLDGRAVKCGHCSPAYHRVCLEGRVVMD